jgi:hypothetical protein
MKTTKQKRKKTMPVKMRQVAFNPDGTPLDEEANDAIAAMTEEMGFPPSTLIAISKVMPDRMNISGLITIVLNMMANYDMFDRSGPFIAELVQALVDLKKGSPELFTDGGVERSRAEGEMQIMSKAGKKLN